MRAEFGIQLAVPIDGASVLAPTALHAQFRSFATGSTWNNAGSALIATHLWYDAQRRAMVNSFRSGGQTSRTRAAPARLPAPSRKPPREAPRPPQVDARVLTVGPNADQETLFTLARSLTPDASAQRQLVASFRQALALFESRTGVFGTPRSLASAMSFFIASNYAVAMERDVEDAQLSALARQLTDVMASNAQIRSVSARNKRQLYDLFVVLAMVAASGDEQAKSAGNADDHAWYRNLARQSLQSLTGLTPEKLHPSARVWTLD